MPEKHYITKERLEELRRELEELIRVQRPEIARRLKEAMAFGDLSENSEYSEAKDTQGFIESRILGVKEIINNAVIIDTGKKLGKVTIGSTIKIKVLNSNRIERFTIVGPYDAAPEEQKISHESPLGRAFLNKKAGDDVEVETPQGKAKYKILSI